MKTVQIFTLAQNSNGVSIIVKHLRDAFFKSGLETEIIHDLARLSSESLIIPYGIKETYLLLKNHHAVKYSFFADAESAGYFNKIKFYIKNGIWGHGDLLYSIKAYIKLRLAEQYILPRVENCILVSQKDIEYYKKISPNTNYIFLPNGVSSQPNIEKTKSYTLRLGLLSGWEQVGRVAENEWFVRKYYQRAKDSGLDLSLTIAGRGQFIEMFRKYKNVEILGEVDNLNTFFSNIDVLVLPTPKGCGILNKALDAFARKTLVIGVPAAFSGLQMFQGSYFEFMNYNGFIDVLKNIQKHPETVCEMVETADQIVRDQCDWDSIYSRFVQSIISQESQLII